MNKKKLLKEILHNELIDNGYEFSINTNNFSCYTWTFAKTCPEGKMRIVIIDNGSNLDLRLEAPVIDPHHLGLGYLLQDSSLDYCLGLPYRDEIEFVKLLEKFKNLIFQYGIPKLNELSRIKIFGPTEYQSIYLRDNLDNILNKYKEEWHFDGVDQITQFKMIRKMLKEREEKTFQEVENDLIALSALYGDLIIRVLGGKWCWNNYAKSFVIREIGVRKEVCHPISDIMKQWKNEACLRFVFKEEDLFKILEGCSFLSTGKKRDYEPFISMENKILEVLDH